MCCSDPISQITLENKDTENEAPATLVYYDVTEGKHATTLGSGSNPSHLDRIFHLYSMMTEGQLTELHEYIICKYSCTLVCGELVGVSKGNMW